MESCDAFLDKMTTWAERQEPALINMTPI